MKLVIRRSEWIRGDDRVMDTKANIERGSSLYREADGKRCCVGTYLRECGVPDFAMNHVSYAHSGELRPYEDLIPTWLRVSGSPIGSTVRGSTDANNLYTHNDALTKLEDSMSLTINDSERELAITGIFAANGVDVEFVDEIRERI